MINPKIKPLVKIQPEKLKGWYGLFYQKFKMVPKSCGGKKEEWWNPLVC
jgi:hypothetical protein